MFTAQQHARGCKSAADQQVHVVVRAWGLVVISGFKLYIIHKRRETETAQVSRNTCQSSAPRSAPSANQTSNAPPSISQCRVHTHKSAKTSADTNLTSQLISTVELHMRLLHVRTNCRCHRLLSYSSAALHLNSKDFSYKTSRFNRKD